MTKFQRWHVKPPEQRPSFVPGYTMYPEEQVKQACEISLMLMLMFVDRRRHPERWLLICQRESFHYPQGSYRSVFWWAMRTLHEEGSTLDDFREYLAWKLEEFNCGNIRREGPRW